MSSDNAPRGVLVLIFLRVSCLFWAPLRELRPSKSSFHVKSRSEEHTSELQPQSNLVCRLLLEKKNTCRSNRSCTSVCRSADFLKMEMKMQIWTCAVAIMLAAGTIGTALAQDSVTLMHVHGLSYSADGKRLMIPSHHGVAVYEKGKWSKAPGPQHDYMGFSATSKHLYSSGHPAPGSGLVNPFGLIRSRDGGKTWDKLGLEGETDFHVLATSWHTNAIYVWNPAPSSRMRSPGLHYTLNDGLAWKAARAAGLQGDPRALAVHPDDAPSVPVATSTGVFGSRTSGT